MADGRESGHTRSPEDLLLEAAYRAEFSPDGSPPDAVLVIAGERLRNGELRARAMRDLDERVSHHPLLHRIDDTARLAAQSFAERRLLEGAKVSAFDGSGSFAGFLRRVLHNLLLDWLRSPAARAERHRAEHDTVLVGREPHEQARLPREEREEQASLSHAHRLTLEALREMPPGRGIPLRLSLWPALDLDLAEVSAIGSFAHCHETASGQADSRACDAGKRCPLPSDAWRASFEGELTQAQATEPDGLSRKTVAELLRIGVGKPTAKREGAVCERISKGRLQLIEELRRAGIQGVTQ